MEELLQEYATWRDAAMRVDRPSGIIRGVKVLGLESRNGRIYLPETLRAAAPLYEGVKVNINHPRAHALAPRDYQERLGTLRNVEVVEDRGLFADLHYNPKHPVAEQLAWDAEHAPSNVGLSHNVQARTSQQQDRVVVEAILKVQSVDLVADPATTRGLFESQTSTLAVTLADLTLEELRRARPDLIECLLEEQAGNLAALETEVERLRGLETAGIRRQLVRQMLVEHGLPDPARTDAPARHLISENFLAELLAAPSEPAVRRLIEERARLVSEAGRWAGRQSLERGKPLARDPLAATDFGHAAQERDFVRSIT